MNGFYPDPNLGGYFQKVQPDGLDTPSLGYRVFERLDLLTDHPEQLISQTTEHQPEKVGAEPVTAQPVGETHILDLLDPVFCGFTPLGVKIPVQFKGFLIGEVAGKEANIHPFTG